MGEVLAHALLRAGFGRHYFLDLKSNGNINH